MFLQQQLTKNESEEVCQCKINMSILIHDSPTIFIQRIIAMHWWHASVQCYRRQLPKTESVDAGPTASVTAVLLLRLPLLSLFTCGFLQSLDCRYSSNSVKAFPNGLHGYGCSNQRFQIFDWADFSFSWFNSHSVGLASTARLCKVLSQVLQINIIPNRYPSFWDWANVCVQFILLH